jgi:hypothetical protein
VEKNAPSIQDVELALDTLLSPAGEWVQGGQRAGDSHDTTPVAAPVPVDCHDTPPVAAPTLVALQPPNTDTSAVAAPGALQPPGVIMQAEQANYADNSAPNDAPNQHSDRVDALFSNIEAPLLQQPAPRRTRQRRDFDMTTVHHSARLAKRPAVSAMERAQRNLCRKLSIPEEEQQPIDDVLRDFISMFQGPLPDHIIATLSAMFDLDDDDSDLLHDALHQRVGEALGDLAPFEEAA